MEVRSELKNKNILLLAPIFFNYQQLIYQKMREMGANVYFYDERSITNSFHKAILKVDPHIFKKRTEKYYDKIIDEHMGKIFDYILVIKCDMLTLKILNKFKTTFPKAKFCLHVMDSVANIPHILDKVNFFDLATSFDRKDCASNYGLKFRPLFYLDEFSKCKNNGKYKYTMLFIGTIHSDRYKILKMIENQCNKYNINYYGFYYLQSKFIYCFYKFTKKESNGRFSSDC